MEKLPVKASECPLRSCRGRAGAGGSARVPSGWRRVGSLVITLILVRVERLAQDILVKLVPE